MLPFFLPILAALIILLGLIALWRFPDLQVYVLLVLIILGELGRITIAGQEILIFDLAVLFVGLVGLLRLWWHGKPVELGHLGIPFLLFLIVAALSLLFGFSETSWLEKGISALYWVRLVSYFVLYVVVRNSALPFSKFLTAVVIAGGALVFLGLLQLKFVPDFTAMTQQGWDPHQGRLLSTWFDPNFLGGFFTFMLLILLNQLYTPTWKKWQRVMLWTVSLLLFVAIYLTLSRSAYLMLLVGLFLLGILRSPKILLIGIVGFFLLLGISSRAQERVADLAQSLLAFGTNSYDYELDATSQLRVISWQQAIDIFGSAPLLGVGYNTMRYVKLNQSMILEEDIHSGSGSDSSILTLLATTGVVGTFFFCWLILVMLQLSFFNPTEKAKNPAAYNFGFGLGLGILALLVHSLTVNSLLFPFILTFVLLCYAVLENHLPQTKKAESLPLHKPAHSQPIRG